MLLPGLALVLFLSACKVVIVVPPGGKVISENGEECLAGTTCTIDVSDTSYDDRFQAVPDDGFIFHGWKKREDGLCAGSRATCRLFTTAFGGIPEFLEIIESDREFYLEPDFVARSRYPVALWRAMLDETDSGAFSSNKFLYRIRPKTGQCDHGELSLDARLRFLQAVNLIRGLHDLPAVDYDFNFDSEAGQAALVQEANGYLSHFPDPADLCYTAAAATGSQTSNIAGGSRQEDPVSHALGWTNDNRNLAALMAAGHRRWVLHPELGYTAYGQVGSSAVMKAFGFNRQPRLEASPTLSYVAFPYRDYPWVLVNNDQDPTPWSLSMVPMRGVSSEFEHFSNASVTVVDTETGSELLVHSQYSDTDGFGLRNFFSWMVDGWEYDRDYTVTVENIAMPGGNITELEYPVRLDRFNLLQLNQPLERGDARNGKVFSGTFKTQGDRDSYRVNLAGQESFTLRSGAFSGGFFVLIYDSNKQLVVSASSAFGSNFAAGTYTVIVSPCHPDGRCFPSAEDYTLTLQ